MGSDTRPASVPAISVNHSLRAAACQVSSASRPPGAVARARFAKAAGASPKNDAPVRLSTTSTPPVGKGCTWASARANAAFGRPARAALARATAIIAVERSTPSAVPFAARRAAARVSDPVPQPTSRTREPGPIAAASSSAAS